eukprot:1065850-Pleurochrysis_carterae.AAC.1
MSPMTFSVVLAFALVKGPFALADGPFALAKCCLLIMRVVTMLRPAARVHGGRPGGSERSTRSEAIAERESAGEMYQCGQLQPHLQCSHKQAGKSCSIAMIAARRPAGRRAQRSLRMQHSIRTLTHERRTDRTLCPGAATHAERPWQRSEQRWEIQHHTVGGA